MINLLLTCIFSKEHISNIISYEKSKCTTCNLEHQENVAKLGFIGVAEESEPGVDECVVVVHALKLVGRVVECREPVSWAVYDSDELGDRKHEVQQLWDEEKHHSFAEVAEDACNSKGHASAVAEGVADEDLARKPVVLQEGERAKQERNHDGERVHMILNDFLAHEIVMSLFLCDFNNVVDYNEAANNEGLAYFNTVNACVNIDSVSAENGNVTHVDVIKNSEINI